MYKEQLRQNKLMKEAQFINKIWLKAFPCCNKGEQLFKANCTPCHAINSKVVGPALRFATKRYDCFWLIEFTRNSQKVIDDKEERAVKVFNEYNKSLMTSFPALSEQEIKSIFQYIDGYNNDEFNWCNNLY
ncbi:MAG: cytochrome c [Saprospirales bacterium]|nr:cytochrome c [Saprospirales bacterium]